MQYPRSLSPELALAIRTLADSGQIPRERIAAVLDLPELYVELVLDTGLHPAARPEWERATDPLVRTLARWSPVAPGRTSPKPTPATTAVELGDGLLAPPERREWSVRVDLLDGGDR